MSENGEIFTADIDFTLPPAVTALTNSTSEDGLRIHFGIGWVHIGVFSTSHLFRCLEFYRYMVMVIIGAEDYPE